MINNKKIVVVLPAYNAAKTLKFTYNEIPFDIVDEVVLVDDYSSDNTIKVAEELNINHIIRHIKNKGYGANQKTCYEKALNLDADIIVMLHPDYQYTPRLIHAMCYLISNDVFDVVLGSRILGNGAIKGGMPRYKYLFNRILTFVQNILMNQKLSEYHTGFRAFSSSIFKDLKIENYNNGFVFDNEMLAQICYLDFRIGEITCPTKYSDDSSSINFRKSMIYGLGVLRTSFIFFASKNLNLKSKLFNK